MYSWTALFHFPFKRTFTSDSCQKILMYVG